MKALFPYSFRSSLERGNSFKGLSDKNVNHPKMSHADAAAWCVQVVEFYKGNEKEIKRECKRIREIYFSQYRSTK